MASDFNGTTGYFRIPDANTGGLLDFGTAAFTIAAWVKPDNYTNAEANIVRKDPGGGDRGLYLFRVAQTTGVLQFQVGSTASFPANFTTIAGSTAVGTSTWAHVACVRDRVGDVIRVYLNGTEDATPVTDKDGNCDNSGSFAIGANYDDGLGGLNGAPFDGGIADVGVWNTALSATDISFLATGYSPLFKSDGLVAYYRLTLADTLEIDQTNALNVTRNGGVTAISKTPIIYPNRVSSLGVGA